MRDRRPADLFEDGNDRDGNVSKHKYGEREGVKNLARGGAVNLLPFGNRRYKSHDVKRRVEAEYRMHNADKSACDKRRIRGDKSYEQEYRVQNKAEKRKNKSGHYVHQHIIARKAEFFGKNAFAKLAAVIAENLIKALRPTHTLFPRLRECFGLFIEKFRVMNITDTDMLQRRVNGKLNVLCQQIILPAAVHINNAFAYHKARAGNGAVRAADEAGIVQEFRFADKPQRITRADPVCAVIFAVSVRCTSLVARVERLVHFKHIVVPDNIVGVKDKESLDTLVRVFGIYPVKNEVKRIALADMRFGLAFVNYRACVARDLRGVVRAVIRNNENVDKFFRIFLKFYAFDKPADNVAFVSRGNDERKMMQF